MVSRNGGIRLTIFEVFLDRLVVREAIEEGGVADLIFLYWECPDGGDFRISRRKRLDHFVFPIESDK